MSTPTAPSSPAQRSSFVTVLAWLLIVPSVLGVLISTLQNVMIATVMPMDQMTLPSGPEAEQLPAFVTFVFGHIRALFVVFWLMTVVSLASGIGLLKRREWARLAVMALLALSILWNLGGLYLQHSLMSSMTATADAPQDFRDQFDSMASTVWMVSLAMALGFSAVSAWLIWRLGSAPIKAEFGSAV